MLAKTKTRPDDPIHADERDPLERELPVCPECLQVGPIAKGAGGNIANLCRGGVENPHLKRNMIWIRFREVR